MHDNPDIILTFKKALEEESEKNNKNNKIIFRVHSYNDCFSALSEFKPNLYDLLLVDINMPKTNGFEFSAKVLELDLNVKICYITAGEMNIEALREQYPNLSFAKPIGKTLKPKG